MKNDMFALGYIKPLFMMLLVFLSFPHVDCIARFTRSPPSVVNAFAGETVRLVWNYTVGNRKHEFQGNSPSWSYGIPGTQNQFEIGSDDKYSDWSFVIHKSSCPSRLLNPVVRVRRESPATLVIANVTTADTGIYICRLLLKASNPISSSMQLFVADILPHFKKVPPTVLYVSEGDTAELDWDYYVNNKSTTFSLNSPMWKYHDPMNGWQTIGFDDGNSGWQWKISPTCPTRLLRPLRVTKIYTASLVLFNVSRSDTGKYNCTLVMKDRSAITSQMELIVTVTPSFTTYIPAVVKVAEGNTLSILCSANGPPTPNTTWFKTLGSANKKLVIISQGVGNATLMIRNITREHQGTYECQANNNPKRSAVTRKTNVVVMYKPSFYNMSDTIVTSMLGAHQRLICTVDGYPTPAVTWNDPMGRQILSNVTSFQWYSEIMIRIKDNGDFGIYTCRAKNILGSSDHNISITNLATMVINEQSSQDKKCYNQTVIITCIVIIVVLFVLNMLWIVAACKRSYRQGEIKMRKRTNATSDASPIDMTEMPTSASFPVESTDIRQSTGDYDSVYEQPVNDALNTGSPRPEDDDEHQLYEFPDDTSINVTVNQQGSPYYQDLVQRPHLTSSQDVSSMTDYQSLNHGQKQVISTNEASKPYQPLQMENKLSSEYQELIL